ncbi:hypothetical protein BL254_15940 [Protofrankia sp. BMG5.30]|uniref:Uncharacterized protein n=2 Tax=Protofrankia TaxID=2994361 RepID=A0ABR5F449_9ACTN|nr:hypothetical protein FrCorBMG51_10535 [Protofrankia coriariae]ONH34533.1 hypothetical protein BL254_15940 [Protofrankia sp. BMG5.30]
MDTKFMITMGARTMGAHGGHEHGGRDHEAGDHSGYRTGAERVDVLERIFDENDRAVAANRGL